jgi:hypothetical protein
VSSVPVVVAEQGRRQKLKWGDRGMLGGNPLLENAKVLTLLVADEADAD